jgi:RecA-family ATPase
MLTHTEHNGEDPHRFFRLLYAEDAPGYLAMWTRQDRLTRWVPANDLDLAAQTARLLAQTKDVYFGVGLQPRDLGQNRRGEGKDVIAIPGLWADIDVQGPAHKASNLPPTKEEARALLAEFPLEPTLVVDSGHGLQPWWLFVRPWVFGDDYDRREAQDLIRQFQTALQAKAASHGWKLDSTSDLARVMRPAGTWNRKLEDPVPVRIVEMNEDRRYNPRDFEPYLSNEVEVPQRHVEPVDGKIPEGSRNSTLASMAGSMRRRGMAEDEIAAALRKVNQRCDPPLNESEVNKIAKSIARYEPRDDALRAVVRPGRMPDRGRVGDDEVGTLLSEVEPEQVSWLWPARIPKGKLTVLDGDPGLGKSATTVDIAARLSSGLGMPDGSPCEAAGVVVCSAEDGLADTVRPRLDAAGGDPERVVSLATIPDEEGLERPISVPEDVPAIRRAIERVDAGLVIIDPIMAFLSGGTDSYRDQDVRRTLAALSALAEETGAAVVIVRHLNKSGGKNPIYRGGGSIGIIGAARSGMLVAKHPEDEDLRVLSMAKSNLAAPAPSLIFTLGEAENGAVQVAWLGETDLTAAELLGAPSDEQQPSAVEEAGEFLRTLLADGPVAQREVQSAAREAGISMATIKRAKEELGVDSVAVRERGKRGIQEWLWSLPEG